MNFDLLVSRLIVLHLELFISHEITFVFNLKIRAKCRDFCEIHKYKLKLKRELIFVFSGRNFCILDAKGKQLLATYPSFPFVFGHLFSGVSFQRRPSICSLWWTSSSAFSSSMSSAASTFDCIGWCRWAGLNTLKKPDGPAAAPSPVKMDWPSKWVAIAAPPAWPSRRGGGNLRLGGGIPMGGAIGA